EAFIAAFVLCWAVVKLLITLELQVRSDRVAQNEIVFTILVLAEIVDAFLLHEAADEIEGGFAISNTILPGFVGAVQPEDEIAEAMILENLFQDLGYRQILENPAIGRAREEPEPRHNRGSILGHPPVLQGLGVELATKHKV